MAQVDPTQGIRHFDSISKGLDIGSVMMMVNLERATIMESQVMDQAQKMKEINDEIRTTQHFMSEARRLKNIGADHSHAAPFVMPDGSSATMHGYCLHRGIQISDGSKNGWDQFVERMKHRVDNLNSNSQLEMIKLQSLINKRNQAFEMSSNHVNKFSGTLDKIISNMR